MVRPDIVSDQVVTPAEAAARLGKPASTVRVWIMRYQIEPVGVIKGRNVYDYRELAQIEAKMRRAYGCAA